MNEKQAARIEETARAVVSSLMNSDMPPADAALSLTTALAFLYKITFEPNGASVYEMSEQIKFNFIETSTGMRKATIQ